MGQKQRPPPKLSATALHGQAVIKQEPGRREAAILNPPPPTEPGWPQRGGSARTSCIRCLSDFSVSNGVFFTDYKKLKCQRNAVGFCVVRLLKAAGQKYFHVTERH